MTTQMEPSPASAGETSESATAAATTTNESKADVAADVEDGDEFDPLLHRPPPIVREGDHCLLSFGDGRLIFAHAVSSARGKAPPVKINKRSYPTKPLVGLPYGTVLEVNASKGRLVPLEEGEDVLPDPKDAMRELEAENIVDEMGGGAVGDGDDDDVEDGGEAEATTADDDRPPSDADAFDESADNRNLVDDNRSQSFSLSQLEAMRKSSDHDGRHIVAAYVSNSSTFDGKTSYSKAKYIARKQLKHQVRCRILPTDAANVCRAYFAKDARKILNLREDTLAQILSYANVCAGRQVLVWENCLGIVTGALAKRMGGYGRILSVFDGQAPGYVDMIDRYNLSFAERHSIRWVHSGELYDEEEEEKDDDGEGGGGEDVNGGGGGDAKTDGTDEGTDARKEEATVVVDKERMDRKSLVWPCHLQPHTRAYLEAMDRRVDQTTFLAKRCGRFARKLTRPTHLETKRHLYERPSDSLIVAAKYDPTTTLSILLPRLAPSGPFVVFHELLEPLLRAFDWIQKRKVAVNLRLTDAWMREYQVLPGRTHPAMTMSQSGGFLLTGVKVCPKTGIHELDDDLFRELKAKAVGRRGKRKGTGKRFERKKRKREEENNRRSSPGAEDGNDAADDDVEGEDEEDGKRARRK